MSDDRVDGTPGQLHEEPPTPARRLNLTLRYVGLLLPLAMLFAGLGLSGRLSYGFVVCGSIGAAVWIAITAVLALRHDWKGAAAISVIYVLWNTPLWLLVAGVFPGR